MTDLPDPLVPPDVDLRDLDGFMLNVKKLLQSELLAEASGEQFKAAVTLWCRAWHQVPAGSLPNKDAVLAGWVGAGSRWKKIKEMALRGFVLCSDGRLYHTTLCEDALEAWDRQKDYLAKRQADNQRLASWREEKRKKKQGRNNDETADETRFAAEGETAKKRLIQGQGQESPISPSAETVAEASAGLGGGLVLTGGKLDEIRKPIWRLIGLTEEQIGTKLASTNREGLAQIRSWLELGLTAEQIVDAATKAYDAKEALGEQIRRPWPYFDEVMKTARAAEEQPEQPDWVDPMHAQWRQRLKRYVEAKVWFDHFGPEPEHPSCLAPLDLLIEFGFRRAA